MRRGHVPMRTCRSCRRKAPKRELERLIEVDGRLDVDATQQAPGRGVYCCRVGACRERLDRKRVRARNRRAPVNRTGDPES